MKSDGLHRLGDVPLAAWQRMLCEELLDLRENLELVIQSNIARV